MAHVDKEPFVLTAQPEGGSLVTSPALPALATAGAIKEEALATVEGACAAIVALSQDVGHPHPWILGQAHTAEA
ncbi:MAG: type II toxin-antitoxin system HicB family antitoxin [Candidatus Entotheonellia bacterium]